MMCQPTPSDEVPVADETEPSTSTSTRTPSGPSTPSLYSGKHKLNPDACPFFAPSARATNCYPRKLIQSSPAYTSFDLAADRLQSKSSNPSKFPSSCRTPGAPGLAAHSKKKVPGARAFLRSIEIDTINLNGAKPRKSKSSSSSSSSTSRYPSSNHGTDAHRPGPTDPPDPNRDTEWQSEGSEWKLDFVVEAMDAEGTYATLVQETWRSGPEKPVFIRASSNKAYLVIFNSTAAASNKGRGKGGTAIILSPRAIKDWKKAGAKSYIGAEVAGCARFNSVILQICDHANDVMSVALCSAYFPTTGHNRAEYEQFTEALSAHLSELSQCDILIVGADINAAIGNRSSYNARHQKTLRSRVGPHGKQNTNARGEDVLMWAYENDLVAASTFFKHKDYATHFSNFANNTSRSDSPASSAAVSASGHQRDGYQNDHFFVFKHNLKAVSDSKKITRNSPTSDHFKVRMSIRIVKKKSNMRMRQRNHRRRVNFVHPTSQPDRAKKKKLDIRALGRKEVAEAYVANLNARMPPSFKARATEHLTDQIELEFLESAMMEALAEAVPEAPKQSKSFFQQHSDSLMPLVSAQQSCLNDYRLARGKQDRAQKWNRYQKARDTVRQAIANARASWAASEIDKLENLSLAPWEAWRAMMRIATGWESHHIDATGNCMRLRKEDGSIATTAEENMEVVEDAFTDRFNTLNPTERTRVFELMDVTPENLSLAGPPTRDEVRNALRRLSTGTSPGLSKVPPEAYKHLSGEAFEYFYECVVRYFENKLDPASWKLIELKCLPKDSNPEKLVDSDRWRGICLKEISNKLAGSVIEARLQAHLPAVTVDNQFGAVKGGGCPNALFTIITSDLKDETDVRHRISKARYAMSKLGKVWDDHRISAWHKLILYRAGPLSILLWGVESWALTDALLSRLAAFHTTACRRIIGLNMTIVQEGRISNEDVLAAVQVPELRDIIAERQLKWIGKVAQMPSDSLPRRMLTAWIPAKRPDGGVQQTTRHALMVALERLDKKEADLLDAASRPRPALDGLRHGVLAHFWGDELSPWSKEQAAAWSARVAILKSLPSNVVSNQALYWHIVCNGIRLEKPQPATSWS